MAAQINMSDNEIRTIIEQALRLDPKYRKQWDVLSLYPDPKTSNKPPRLALIHYNLNYDPDIRDNSPVRELRGPVIDLKTKVVYAESYGHPERIPVYSPILASLGEDGKPKTYEFQTETKVYHSETNLTEMPKIAVGTREFDASTVRFFPGYETVVIRVFKFDGVVFFATHKSLYAAKSFFGEAKFMEIYERLRGPEVREKDGTLKAGSQQLFNPRLEYSPYCYIFLVVDNKVRLATTTRDNRVIYVATKEMWSPSMYAKEPGDAYFCEADDDFVDPIEVKFVDYKFENPDDKPITRQSEIDVTLANAILFPDTFANTVAPEITYPDGGSKKVEKISEQMNYQQLTFIYNEDQSKVLRVDYVPPKKLDKDERLHGGDFVIMYLTLPAGNTLICHLESIPYNYRVKVTNNDPNYYHRYVLESQRFIKSSIDSLKEDYPIIIERDFTDPNMRLQLWATIFLLAVRIEAREEVSLYYNKYQKDIRELGNFILYNVTIEDVEEKKRLDENTLKRFTDLRNRALQGRLGHTPHDWLITMLYNETPDSLYKMMSSVRKVQELRKKTKK